MKTHKLYTLFVLLICGNLSAQTDVTLNIYHFLNDETFSFNTAATNNLDHDFEVDRLEYYLSRFTIVHDGGQESYVNDLFALVKADQSTSIELGNFDITEVESLRFHIGVGPSYNHLDPATYPADHPLAPQNPSMHWGWTSGYRFIAFEGNGGPNLNQMIELHGLGDDNYFEANIPLGAVAESGSVILDVDANCNHMVADIELNSGVIVHGDYGMAVRILENMRDYVFSATNSALSSSNISPQVDMTVYPNPSANGVFRFKISDTEILNNPRIEIRNILGQTLFAQNLTTIQDEITHQLSTSGIYIVSLYEGNTVVNTQKIVVQ